VIRPGVLAAVLVLIAGSQPAIAQPVASASNYKVSGAIPLRPERIWDDGARTYLVWRSDVELPAVFSIGSDGREVLTDGQMRNGEFVLDRVHSTLVFRIDKNVATARRKAKR
jgi:type IV secretory pathway VirB9-like protein